MFNDRTNSSFPMYGVCHVPVNQNHKLWLRPKVDRSIISREWLTEPSTLKQQLSMRDFAQKARHPASKAKPLVEPPMRKSSCTRELGGLSHNGKLIFFSPSL